MKMDEDNFFKRKKGEQEKEKNFRAHNQVNKKIQYHINIKYICSRNLSQNIIFQYAIMLDTSTLQSFIHCFNHY